MQCVAFRLKTIGVGQFAHVSGDKASRAIRYFPPETSPLDYIPISFLKDCNDVFGPIIARFADLSFTEGKFPNMFKVDQVMQLLKKSVVDIDGMYNYLNHWHRHNSGSTLKVQPMRYPCNPPTVRYTRRRQQ